MIQVIDSIRFDEQALRGHPEFLEKLGPGLLVTINVEQRPSFRNLRGSTARVYRPDGTVIDRVVGAVEVYGPEVGLFFSNTEQHEIPRLSKIELSA
jgi:hypothetical protein